MRDLSDIMVLYNIKFHLTQSLQSHQSHTFVVITHILIHFTKYWPSLTISFITHTHGHHTQSRPSHTNHRHHAQSHPSLTITAITNNIIHIT